MTNFNLCEILSERMMAGKTGKIFELVKPLQDNRLYSCFENYVHDADK